jgi:hypothetical protein
MKDINELAIFFSERKRSYHDFSNNITDEDLYRYFISRKKFADILISADNIIDWRYEENQNIEKNTAKQKRDIVKRLTNKEALVDIVQEIENNKPHTPFRVESSPKDYKSGISALTFIDVLSYSQKCHKSINAHIEFLKDIHNKILPDSEISQYLNTMNDISLQREIIDLYNSKKPDTPDDYAKPLSNGSVFQEWAKIDLRYSDEMLIENFRQFISEVRKKDNFCKADDRFSEYTKWKNITKSNAKAINMFMIIDIKIIALFYNINITNEDILFISEDKNNEASRVSVIVKHFTDTFRNNQFS